MRAQVKRVPTGIPGFDKLVEGGFPENFVILLAGSPGTGKSIFSLEYIYNGATMFNENGVYITLEQSVDNLKKQALQFGWDFDELEKKGKVIIEHVEEFDMDWTLKRLKNLVEKFRAKRVVLDSLSGVRAQLSIKKELMSQIKGASSQQHGAYLQIAPDREGLRKIIWDIFMKLSQCNCTTLIPSEVPTGSNQLSNDGVSEFACDGIVELRMVPVMKMIRMRIAVHKMRQTRIDPVPRDFDFTEKGIIVLG